ncbi:DUF637 domain-containing protein [Vibrio mangrovi]|uniref:Adenosine monophosphate-protein transferase and cysteine protease IbpA n=1 Tax=Vibrio mangrovi TaxID=474394 RepID=A0A1Y6IY33_9VIBR|nr:DUF637 domain-containing protein [Vibrio mangrovi]MDW6004663.1 DUF637 domain-containing protein [Vibrio mangrovi]SMS00953.1 Adenosine monophosphate-protein transferase and cysteine protease IbpA precursor [Vibrio mangrovi]
MKKDQIPSWQRLTSSTLLPILFTHLAFPVYASVQQSIALDSITNAVSSSARYELKEQIQDYLYAGAIEQNELAIFDGFGFFFNQIKASYPEMLSAYQGKNTSLNDIPARFGTPYVERGVIRQQITQLLNKSWISAPGYSSYNEQTQKLYENAVSYAKSHGKKLGQALTADEITHIPADMVWPEIRVINGNEYIVPFVYLTPGTIADQKLSESTLAAGSASIKTDTFVVNDADVHFKHNALLDITHDFINTKGKVSGGELTIRTGRELQNLSGTISGDDVSLIANKLVNDTLVTRFDYGHGYSESFDQIGSIVSLGDLNIRTASDVVSHGGEFSAQGDLRIQSQGNVILVPQTAKSERAESGSYWSDSESSLVNLQTHLSAIDTLSLISGGQVVIAGSVLESQGLLEILAAHGITLKSVADMNTFDRRFEVDSGGLFGSKESESESQTESQIVRTLLKAGQSMVLHTIQGDVSLEAVTIDSQGISKIISDYGAVDFKLAKLIENYSYEKSYDGALAFRHQGNGYQREVAYYSEFVNSGGIMLNAYSGVRIQYAGDKNDMDTTLATLAQTPELSWMLDIRNDPSLNVDWQQVQLVMQEWDYDQSGLTPAAMAIIAVAMAVATSGAGIAVIGGEGPLYTAINVGFKSLISQAGSRLIANDFDVKATLQDLSSKQALISLATSMVTAGVLKGIDTHLFTEGTDAANAIQDATSIDIVGNSIEAQIIRSVVHSTVSIGINTAVQGGDLSDFGESFATSFASSMVSIIGSSLSEKISDAAGHKGVTDSNPSGTPQISEAVKYIAHAALGCGIGSLGTAIGGGSGSDMAMGCASGATGSVIGEYVSEQYGDIIAEKDQKIEAWTRDFLSGGLLCPKTIKKLIKKLHQEAINVPRYAASVAVYAFGDTGISGNTANNVVQQNALYLLSFAFDEDKNTGESGAGDSSNADEDSCLI